MTQIFLGYPPEHIKNWIIEHSQANPPTGNATWVPAVHTDEWVFSDGQEHSIFVMNYWENDDPMNGMVYYEIDGGDCYGIIYRRDHMDWTVEKALEELDKMTVLDCGGKYIAYRKYTPAHWEDADGNWINGSWGDWKPESVQIDWHEIGDDIGFGATASDTGWYYMGIVLGDANANILTYHFSDQDPISPNYYYVVARTWTNTKPSPEN